MFHTLFNISVLKFPFLIKSNSVKLCVFPACQSSNGGQVCVTLCNSYFTKNRKGTSKNHKDFRGI